MTFATLEERPIPDAKGSSFKYDLSCFGLLNRFYVVKRTHRRMRVEFSPAPCFPLSGSFVLKQTCRPANPDQAAGRKLLMAWCWCREDKRPLKHVSGGETTWRMFFLFLPSLLVSSFLLFVNLRYWEWLDLLEIHSFQKVSVFYIFSR